MCMCVANSAHTGACLYVFMFDMRVSPHHAEAAADAGLHVAAPEGSHLAQLAGDLDGFVEQHAEVTLVGQTSRTTHLPE